MTKALRICIEPGCPNATPTRRCRTHQAAYDRATHANTSNIYKTMRWRRARLYQLRAQPWCQASDCHNLATDVDHITPLRDGGPPYDLANLQSLCKKHHSQKTAREVWHTKQTGG